MTIELTHDQIDLMQRAIEENIRATRDRERVACSGLSSCGIELCRQRLRMEALLAAVEEQRSARYSNASSTRVSTFTLRRDATPEPIA